MAGQTTEGKRAVGRPRVHHEPRRKVTMEFSEDLLEALEVLAQREHTARGLLVHDILASEPRVLSIREELRQQKG